jgi:hypothetical protein
MKTLIFHCENFKSTALTVPEIFNNLLAEDTWRKSSSSMSSWSIRRLKMLLLIEKTHIFHPAKILD